MAIQRFILQATAEHQGKRLDQVLSEWLPQALKKPVSKAKARMLIVAGAVYLNGRRVRIASKTVLARARIDVYVDIRKLEESAAPSRDQSFVMSADAILFEDEHIIVVNKPPGLPTQPTLDEARDNLYAAVKKFLSARDKVADAYLGLHHRLDRDTSGVILFTKRKEVNAAVSDLFTKHEAVKVYQALALLPPEGASAVKPEWSVKNYLGKDPSSGKRARFTAVRSGGDFAHTDFKLIEAFPRAALIEARLHTGRTHQIRVHLSGEGMPILGDTHYGAPPEPGAPRVMLHAARLTFPHPVHKTELSVQSPLPEDFLRCLAALKRA